MISTRLGAVDVLPLVTYDGLDLVCLRVSTDGRTDKKISRFVARSLTWISGWK